MIKNLLFILTVLSVLGCNEDPYFGPVYPELSNNPINSSGNKLIIGCEGNFQFSNASISIIDLETDQVASDVYKSLNGSGIGDVLQSFTSKGDTLLVVLNNTGTIKLLDKTNLLEIASFSGFRSPRYAKFINDQEIVITDLYADQLLRFNLETDSITGSMDVFGGQGQIILSDSLAFVSNLDQKQIDVIDLKTFTLQESIKLEFVPTHLKYLEVDRFIVAGTSENNSEESVISVFNSKRELLMSTIILKKLTGLDAELGSCFYADSKNVYKYDALSGISANLFAHRCLTPYSLRFSSSHSLLVICDARDYISNGVVQVFNTEGMFFNNYDVGIIPQAVQFTL